MKADRLCIQFYKIKKNGHFYTEDKKIGNYHFQLYDHVYTIGDFWYK